MQKLIDNIISIIHDTNNNENFENTKAKLLNELEHLKKQSNLLDFKFNKALKDKNVVFSLLSRTSEDLKKALKEIKIRADQLNILLNTIPALVFFKDLDLNYLLVNKTFLDFVNTTEDMVIGNKVKDIVTDYDLSNNYTKLEKSILNTGTQLHNIVETVIRDDKQIIISTNLAPVSNTEGKIIGLVGVSQDITKQKEYEVKLKKAKELAEQGMQAKSMFLANMSHEIRTPLNGIIGMSQILKKSELTEKQTEYLSTIINSGDSLLSLITDILDFSKIEAGKIEFDHKNFELLNVIKDISNILSFKAEEKGLEFSYLIDEKVPLKFNGDSYRLKQIVLNLANNAIKFTEKGSVKILVRLLNNKLDKSKIRFEIVDTGIGISEEKKVKLFVRFSQIDASTTKAYSGTGLGLAISKKLTEMMSGEIGVESKEGSGSTFWFTVKLDPPDKDDISINNLSSSGAKVNIKKGLRVLLAEDNFVNQKIASFNLQQLGYETIVAQNGKEAIDKFVNESFDLVLMDIQMPVMNGYDASKEIRRLEENMPGNNHIPIIALTANAMKGDMEKCISAGMDAYLSKPFKPNELLSVLKEFISIK